MRKVLTVLVLLVLAGAGGATGAAQTPGPGGERTISGQVVDGTTGRPVSAATVILSLAKMEGLPVVTGADGRFVFRVTPQDASYTLTARKGGYAEGGSGRMRIGGALQPVQLNALTPSANVLIRVWKLGAITGTVTDEAGEPVVGVQVRALQRTASGGRRTFAPGGATMTTDDRGVYRVSNLPPGEYIVLTSPPAPSLKPTVFADIARTGRANGELAFMFGGTTPFLEAGDAWLALSRGSVTPPPPRNGRLQIYPPTFHPSATALAQASTVTLGSGEERASIDIQLAPAAAARVAGLLADSSGPAANAMLRLVPAGFEDMPGDLVASVSGTDASGGFAFAAVPPGQYTLRGRGRVPGAGVLDTTWVALPVTVSGDDIDGVVATLSPALRIRARMQYDGTSPQTQLAENGRFTTLPFTLESVNGPPENMTVGAASIEQGAIVFGYPPGRYRVRVMNSPQGWMFKSATLNGVDVSETPFDLTKDVDGLVLTFTDRWSGMSGAVQGTGADAATVLVFPTDAQLWMSAGPNSRRFKSARGTATRQFGIGSLPPGDYYAIAVRDEDAADWRDPAALEALAREAARVTILEGEHRTIDLQVREVKR